MAVFASFSVDSTCADKLIWLKLTDELFARSTSNLVIDIGVVMIELEENKKL